MICGPLIRPRLPAAPEPFPKHGPLVEAQNLTALPPRGSLWVESPNLAERRTLPPRGARQSTGPGPLGSGLADEEILHGVLVCRRHRAVGGPSPLAKVRLEGRGDLCAVTSPIAIRLLKELDDFRTGSGPCAVYNAGGDEQQFPGDTSSLATYR